MDTVEIGIESPRELAGQHITGERVPVGVPADYKPCIARLPDGRLLLVAFAPYQLEEGKKREEILLFRSEDGGATWSDAENLTTGHGLVGREPYLTVLRDGTVLMTVHFLSRDVRNSSGYNRSFVHRSTDGGRTWSTTVAEPDFVAPGGMSCTTRTVLELDDGSLLLGVGSTGAPFLWRSRDGGASWPDRQPTVIEELRDDYPYPFLGEAVWWQAPSGRILVLARVDSPLAGRFAVEIDDPEFGRSDNVDRLILYASDDRGRSFRPVEAFGRPGEMYPAILRLPTAGCCSPSPCGRCTGRWGYAPWWAARRPTASRSTWPATGSCWTCGRRRASTPAAASAARCSWTTACWSPATHGATRSSSCTARSSAGGCRPPAEPSGQARSSSSTSPRTPTASCSASASITSGGATL